MGPRWFPNDLQFSCWLPQLISHGISYRVLNISLGLSLLSMVFIDFHWISIDFYWSPNDFRNSSLGFPNWFPLELPMNSYGYEQSLRPSPRFLMVSNRSACWSDIPGSCLPPRIARSHMTHAAFLENVQGECSDDRNDNSYTEFRTERIGAHRPSKSGQKSHSHIKKCERETEATQKPSQPT